MASEVWLAQRAHRLWEMRCSSVRRTRLPVHVKTGADERPWVNTKAFASCPVHVLREGRRTLAHST